MSIRYRLQVPPLGFVPREKWDEEYHTIHAIPSSMREEPAKALVLFANLLNLTDLRVLDLGCGNGRNAVYLAKRGCVVTATDFSEEALAVTMRRACAAGVQDRITIQRSTDFTAGLPFPPGAYDLVLDAYTFCHILDGQLSEKLWQNIETLIKPRGHALSISFSTDDAYYSQFRSNGEVIVTDPSNGISKRLYDESEIKTLFSKFFDILYFSRFEFKDVVHAREYLRVVLIAVLRRR